MSGPNAGDRFGPDGETEERPSTDEVAHLAEQLDLMRGQMKGLEGMVIEGTLSKKAAPAPTEQAAKAAPPSKPSDRKGDVAKVAIIFVSLVAVALAVWTTVDGAIICTGYFTTVGGIVAHFGQGNTSEHALKTRHGPPQGYQPPPQTYAPPPGWGPR